MSETTTARAQQPATQVEAPPVDGHARRGRPGPLLGEIIVDLGFVQPEVVEEAVRTARARGRLMGQVLLEAGLLAPDQLAQAVAVRFGLEHVNLDNYQVDMAAANLVSADAAKRLGAIPIGFVGSATLVVAMSDPSNVMAIDDIAMLTGYNVQPAVSSAEAITALINRLNRLEETVQEAAEEDAEEEVSPTIADIRESVGDAPIIKMVHSIIGQAVEQGASDLHFEPAEGEMQVRFRIDGVMIDSATIPRRMAPGVISRLKLMSDLDISERRLPQDGRMAITVEGRPVDIRVVVLPLVASESVVLRILDRETTPMSMEDLGMRADERKRFEAGLRRSHGAVLATGPTGAGKSTTLYAALLAIRTREKTIVTIEDPVEYRLDGIKQVQVNEKTGLTFATGLRSMMRADPDIMMVGEIRDRDSAQIAVEAALTGHLVLSTLHTNDAPTAVSRLIEMDIEPFLVASAIECVVAQRLARRLCTTCKRAANVPASAITRDGAGGTIEVFEPDGCSRCGGTGYRGRIGLFEVMTVTEEIRSLAVERAPATAIAKVAQEQGMTALREDGLAKVRAGETSLAEVGRVTGD